MECTYEQFKREIYKITGLNLDYYKEKQMKRRIDSWISSKGLEGYPAFLKVAKTDNVLLDEFMDYITINVSEFFRNPEQWVFLEKNVLPNLLEKKGKIKVWSAACSTGDEPYSLAMLLLKYVPKDRFSIVATDIDKVAVETARTGVYSKKSVANVPKEFMGYFTETERGRFQISDDIKKTVTFKLHNLFSDDYPKHVDLLVCRNVLIYFTEEVKEDIYKRFYSSMTHGSVLFMGNTEQMMRYKEIGFDRMASFYYQKK